MGLTPTLTHCNDGKGNWIKNKQKVLDGWASGSCSMTTAAENPKEAFTENASFQNTHDLPPPTETGVKEPIQNVF